MRSASSAPISFPVMISSFARPRPTTCGSREEPPTSGMSPIRVSGSPTIASAESTRRSQASASSSAPPMHAPWIAQMTGLGISSARFHASSTPRRNVRRRSGASARSASAPRSMPEENMGPAPRTTTQRTPGSSAAARSAAPVARMSSSWNALRFSGRFSTTWRTGPRSSDSTRSLIDGEGYWAGMSTSLRSPAVHDAVEQLAGLEALDEPAKAVGKAVRDVVPPGAAKDALSGVWLGHALHPLLTDLPIGTYTSAVLLDWLGGRDGEAAADRLVGLGLLFTLPTAAT